MTRIVKVLFVPWFLFTSAIVHSQPNSVGGEAVVTPMEMAIQAFEENRLQFRERKAELQREIVSLQSDIRDTEAELQQTKATRDRLALERREADLAQPSRPLYLTISEKVVSTTIYPWLGAMSALNSVLTFLGQESSELALGISITLSILLCFLLCTTFLFVRKFYPRFYARYRLHIGRVVLALLLIIPVSTFAQEAGGPESELADDPTLESILARANAALDLSVLEKNIRYITDPMNEGRMVRLSGVVLENSPLRSFERFVVGTGEGHSTLAALYIVSDNEELALEQLRKLLQSDIKFQSNEKESIIVAAAAFLLSSNETELARLLLDENLASIYQLASFDRLFDKLVSARLSVTASDLASQFIELTSSSETLVSISRKLYAARLEDDARAGLKKALETARKVEELQATIDLAAKHNELTILEEGIEKLHRGINDIRFQIGFAGDLERRGYTEQSAKLVDDVIDAIENGRLNRLDGERVSPTDGLVFVSYTCFDRGKLEQAQRAALGALKPLSRAEKSALIMKAPSERTDPLRVPQPERLVAPLYTGLLLEAQGRKTIAKNRYETELGVLLEQVFTTHGLSVPDLINHLSVLGTLFRDEDERATLIEVDKLLVRMEEGELQRLRYSQAGRVEELERQLQQVRSERDAVALELPALEESSHSGFFSDIYAGIFRPLRALSMLAVFLIFSIGSFYIAYSYAVDRVTHRFYAFVTKSLETVGWVYTLSGVGAFIGAPLILLGQHFMLHQTGNENIGRIAADIEPDEEHHLAHRPIDPS
tara:strand:+ start:48021 stop:50348 length:2328 start_codon:yes stop_codon:yes gene_type:complete